MIYEMKEIVKSLLCTKPKTNSVTCTETKVEPIVNHQLYGDPEMEKWFRNHCHLKDDTIITTKLEAQTTWMK
jgi:hypothetical protein